MVEDGAFSHKIDYVAILKKILNPEGHPNCITGSNVTAILLNGLIFPIGGASAVKGLRLQPAQQACFKGTFSILCLICPDTKGTKSTLNIFIKKFGNYLICFFLHGS